MATREQILNCFAKFTWLWGQSFFVETPYGNFHWKDPEYDGDNTFTYYPGSYKDFIENLGIPCGRDKGRSTVHSFCGDQIIIIDNREEPKMTTHIITDLPDTSEKVNDLDFEQMVSLVEKLATPGTEVRGQAGMQVNAFLAHAAVRMARAIQYDLLSYPANQRHVLVEADKALRAHEAQS